MLVPDSCWDRIKHEKQPASTQQMNHEELDNSLVTTQEQLKRQRKDDGACLFVSNLYTTS